jgi:hypothetical protein
MERKTGGYDYITYHISYIVSIKINSVTLRCTTFIQLQTTDFQQGKKLPLDWKEDKGEVTDEDEGAETSKKKEKQKRVPLCKELSDLISLARCSFISFLTSKEIRTLIHNKRTFYGLVFGISIHMKKQKNIQSNFNLLFKKCSSLYFYNTYLLCIDFT